MAIYLTDLTLSCQISPIKADLSPLRAYSQRPCSSEERYRMTHQAVLVSGVRTPFMRSHKSYVQLSACDLGRLAVSGLLERTGVSPEKIEQERQAAIEKHKKDNSKYRKKDMIDSSIYVFYAAIILLIHVLIIRRTKED